jgi:hypothetical protein
MSDSHADIAALVYGPTDDPDILLRAFAEELIASGFRVAGLVQTRLESGAVGAWVYPPGEIVSLSRNDGVSGEQFDASMLLASAESIRLAIAARADLVIVNRFGKLEVRGDGLVRHLLAAIEGDMPALVAVAMRDFDQWLQFCEGMCVRIPCRHAGLMDWWRSLGTSSFRRRRETPVDWCGRVK